jgi:hypothetical protein
MHFLNNWSGLENSLQSTHVPSSEMIYQNLHFGFSHVLLSFESVYGPQVEHSPTLVTIVLPLSYLQVQQSGSLHDFLSLVGFV